MCLRKSKETNYCKKVAKVFMFLVLLTSQSFTKLPKTKRIFKLFINSLQGINPIGSKITSLSMQNFKIIK